MDFRLNNCVSSTGKKHKRVGRGIGSGRGKTSGRGVKGQKSRTGVSLKGFEGGQQSYVTSLPKRGFKNIFREPFVVVNLGFIQGLIDKSGLPDGSLCDKELLMKMGFMKRLTRPVKVLASGELTARLVFDFDAFSASALAKIKASDSSIAE